MCGCVCLDGAAVLLEHGYAKVDCLTERIVAIIIGECTRTYGPWRLAYCRVAIHQ